MKKPGKSKGKPALIDRIMAEMFARVGRTFSPEACTKSDWYLENSWTWEQQADFQEWLAGQFWRRGYTNQKANYQAGVFILFFGWKVDPQAPLMARQKRGNPARGRTLLAEIQQHGSWKKRRATALKRLAALGITAKSLSVATRDIEQFCDEMESGDLVETRFVLPPDKWAAFNAALDAPAKEIPALKELFTKPLMKNALRIARIYPDESWLYISEPPFPVIQWRVPFKELYWVRPALESSDWRDPVEYAEMREQLKQFEV